MATTPVIDLGPYLFIGNHGVLQSLVERMFEETERFHSLPIERKLGVRLTDKVVGYLPQGGQTQHLEIRREPPSGSERVLLHPPGISARVSARSCACIRSRAERLLD